MLRLVGHTTAMRNCLPRTPVPEVINRTKRAREGRRRREKEGEVFAFFLNFLRPLSLHLIASGTRYLPLEIFLTVRDFGEYFPTIPSVFEVKNIRIQHKRSLSHLCLTVVT